MFQYYRSGKLCLPYWLYENANKTLVEVDQIRFKSHIQILSANWGKSNAGKTTSSRYPEFIRKARAELERRKGLIDFSQMRLTENLCEFVGAFIGDGGLQVNGRYRGVNIYGHATLDWEYHERIGEIIQKTFGLLPFRKIKPNANACYLNVKSRRLCKLFASRFGFPSGCKTYTVKIPEEILKADRAFLFRTIRGIFDTDGNFFLDKRKTYRAPYPRITLRTASKPLFRQLKQILEKEFSLHAAQKKNGSKKIFEIVIYGHNQIEKWMKIIGFSNPRHLNKIAEYSRRRELNPQPIAYKAIALPIELRRHKLQTVLKQPDQVI